MRFLAESSFKKPLRPRTFWAPGIYRLLGEVQQEELSYNARESAHALIGLDNSRPRAPSAQALIPRPSLNGSK